ncbi:hypothetical protein ACHAXT_003945 [Thalassiosira profunda]
MKLLSVLALAASSLSSAAAVSGSAADASDYEHARVVPGVLSAESIAKLHGHVGTFRFLRKTGLDGTNRKYGEAAVEPKDLKRILKSIDDNREVHETTNLRSTLITGDTVPHRDSKVGGDGKFADDEDVMFVCLNDNEGAYFQIGEDKVPIEAGTLVTFKGNQVVHNTVVPSGTEVRLLGPITSRDLAGALSSCTAIDKAACEGTNTGNPAFCCVWTGDDVNPCQESVSLDECSSSSESSSEDSSDD